MQQCRKQNTACSKEQGEEGTIVEEWNSAYYSTQPTTRKQEEKGPFWKRRTVQFTAQNLQHIVRDRRSYSRRGKAPQEIRNYSG